MRVGGASYSISFVLDEAGHAHIATTRSGAVVYATNKSGSFEIEEIAASAGDPDIAIDSDGSLAIAYSSLYSDEPFGCCFSDGTLLTTNDGAGWAEPTEIEAFTAGPSVEFNDGTIHVVYQDASAGDLPCDPPPTIRHATFGPGGSSTRTVVPAGNMPLLALAPDGTPRVAFSDACGELEPPAAWYADGSAGAFVAVPIEGTLRSDTPAAMAIDGQGTVHLLVMDESFYEMRYLALTSDGQVLSTEFLDEALSSAAGIAVDDSGGVHVVIDSPRGLIYGFGSEGEFAFLPNPITTAGLRSVAIAVDGAGRPHVAYAVGGTERGLYYSVGPIFGQQY